MGQFNEVMDHLKRSPVALYAAVLGMCVLVDTILGIFINFSMFDFWTQFFLGFMVIGIGAALCYWTLKTLEVAGVQVTLDETPASLITNGPYAWTRNPLYVGMTVAYVGVAILFDSPIALLALVPLLYYVKTKVVPAEESLLASTFGASYEGYKTKVKRWV